MKQVLLSNLCILVSRCIIFVFILHYWFFFFFCLCYIKEILLKSSGETYVWDPVKEKRLLKKLDDFFSCNSGKQPTIQIYDLWANEFNSKFGGVPAYGVTLYQKKRADEKNL